MTIDVKWVSECLLKCAHWIGKHTFNRNAVKAFFVLLLCSTVDLNTKEWSILPRRISVARFAHTNVASTAETPAIQWLTLSTNTYTQIQCNSTFNSGWAAFIYFFCQIFIYLNSIHTNYAQQLAFTAIQRRHLGELGASGPQTLLSEEFCRDSKAQNESLYRSSTLYWKRCYKIR